MDEVICMFLEELCSRYNKCFNGCLSPEQLLQYDMTDFIGEAGKALFLQNGFFTELKPFPGAVETLEQLHFEGHAITIVTDTKGHQGVERDKGIWLKRHLPFISRDNVVFTADKHLLEGDLIFDDSPAVIEKFPEIKVVMDRPYNKMVPGYRIYDNDWVAFYNLVKELANPERGGIKK